MSLVTLACGSDARDRSTVLDLAAPVLAVPPVLALALSFLSLRWVDVSQMTDVGLISVLPPTVHVAVIVLTAGFSLTLAQRKTRTVLLTLYVVSLVLILFGMPTPLSIGPRFAPTWRHIGVADYISRHGSVDPSIDAYFDWPVFFVLISFVTGLAGNVDIVQIASWGTVFFNFLYWPVLFLLHRVYEATPTQRWLTIWIFYIGNWISQDYFSPQGFAFFLYLVIIALILNWFSNSTSSIKLRRDGLKSLVVHMTALIFPTIVRRGDNSHGPAGLCKWHGAMLLFMIIAMSSVISMSHQLTPFTLIASTALLVIFGYSLIHGLPLTIGIITVAWISFMTVPFLSGNFSSLASDIGNVSATVGTSVSDRVAGSSDHQIVVYFRLIFSAIIWILGISGLLFVFVFRGRDARLLILSLSPFLLLAGQRYGGEIFLRVYLFSLPFAAIGVSTWLDLILQRLRRYNPAILLSLYTAIGFSAALVFWIARYGNERFDYFDSNDLAAASYVYEYAEPKSRIIAFGFSWPWYREKYEDFRYAAFSPNVIRRGNLTALETRLLDYINQDAADNMRAGSNANVNVYVVVTRSQTATLEVLYGVPRGEVQNLVQRLQESEDFELQFQAGESKIFKYKPGP